MTNQNQQKNYPKDERIQDNILMGFWHNWPSQLNSGQQGGEPATMSITEVHRNYNVIAVAFMNTTGNTDLIPNFIPFGGADKEFIKQIKTLHEQKRVVLLSLGGANANIKMHKGQEEALSKRIIELSDKYGFDGLDINLYQTEIDAADNSYVIPEALKLVKDHYKAKGKNFIITISSEFPNLRESGKYVPYIKSLEGYYDFIVAQFYNQGNDGVLGDDGQWISQNDDTKKEEFLFHLTKSIVTGTKGYIKIPHGKFIMGLPANTDAANSGYVSHFLIVREVFNKLESEKKTIRGLMTWSVNWDNGKSKDGEKYNWRFASDYGYLTETFTNHHATKQEPVQSYTLDIEKIFSIKDVSYSKMFTMILSTSGDVYVAGNNHYNVMADTVPVGKNITTFTMVPDLFEKRIKYKAILAAGMSTAYVVDTEGRLYVVGLNWRGQLGLGVSDDKNTQKIFREVLTNGSTGDSFNVTDIWGGNYTTFIRSNGKIYVAGAHDNWQAGLGYTVSGGRVTTFTEIPPDRFNREMVTKITTSENTSLALTNQGDVFYAGANSNTSGALGGQSDTYMFTKFPASLPPFNQKIKNIFSGTWHNFVLTESGELWAAGYNALGQLGINSTADAKKWTRVTNVPSPIDDIGTGSRHTFILSKGNLYATGHNDFGQLGLGDTSNRKIFTALSIRQPVAVEKIYSGTNYDCKHTYMKGMDGRFYNVGWNAWGQLSNGTFKNNNVFQRFYQKSAKLLLDKPVYGVNEKIEVSFADGSTHTTAWIGIYKQSDTPGVQDAIKWAYTGGVENGSVNFQLEKIGQYFVVYCDNIDKPYIEIAPRVFFNIV